MKVIHSAIFAAFFSLTAVFACNGQLKVGEDDMSGAGAPGSGGSVGSGGGFGSGGSSGGSLGSGGSSGGSLASGGFGSGGGSGGSVDWTDEVEPTPARPGSSEECPSGPLLDASECDPLGLVCGYQWEDENYEECICIRSGDVARWSCSFAGAGNLNACPDEKPEAGSDCYGYIGLLCYYPPGAVECYCNGSNDNTWNCPEYEYRTLSDPPVSPDSGKAVKDLTEAERQAWCEWYSMESSGGPGHAPVPNVDVDENGYLMGPGCQSNHTQPCVATMAVLSVEQCVLNLSVSECDSPLSNLNACAANVHTGKCGPLDYGCPDYLATPGCAGTIAVVSADGCSVRVE